MRKSLLFLFFSFAVVIAIIASNSSPPNQIAKSKEMKVLVQNDCVEVGVVDLIVATSPHLGQVDNAIYGLDTKNQLEIKAVTLGFVNTKSEGTMLLKTQTVIKEDYSIKKGLASTSFSFITLNETGASKACITDNTTSLSSQVPTMEGLDIQEKVMSTSFFDEG